MSTITSGLVVFLFLVIILGTDVIESAWFYCSLLAFSEIEPIHILETAFLKTVVIQGFFLSDNDVNK